MELLPQFPKFPHGLPGDFVLLSELGRSVIPPFLYPRFPLRPKTNPLTAYFPCISMQTYFQANIPSD